MTVLYAVRTIRSQLIATSLSPYLLLVTAVIVALLFGWALAFERWVLVAMLVLAALGPAFVRWPVVTTFGVYAFLVPFDAVAVIEQAGGSTLTKLWGGLTGVVLLGTGLAQRRLVRPPAPAVLWTMLIVWGALSAAWALDPDLALGRLPTALSLLFLYLTTASIQPSRTELFFVYLLTVAGGTAAATAAYLSPGTPHFTGRATLSMGDQVANPNHLAAALLLPLALAFAGYLRASSLPTKLLALVPFGLVALGIYITASRKAVLAMAAVVTVFLYRSSARKPIFIAAALLIVLIAAAPEGLSQRIDALVSGEDVTGSGRTSIWATGVAALSRFGLLGAGLDNFPIVYSRLAPHGPFGSTSGAHNTYLAVWVELGVVGLALLLSAVSAQFLTFYRAPARELAPTAVEAACLASVVTAFFSDSLWFKDFWLPWILAAWVVRTQPAVAAAPRNRFHA